MTDRNKTYRNERVSTHSMFNEGPLIDKRPFQDWVMREKNCSLQRILPTSPEDPLFPAEHQRPHCKQDECSLLSCFAV